MELKKKIKEKFEDAKATYKLHRSQINAMIAAAVGGTLGAYFITKKLRGEESEEEEPKTCRRWQDDPEWEEGTVSYGEDDIHGAWFTTHDGGRIFFAEKDDGSLP